MKSIAIAAQSIALGENNIVVAGGMENMSLSPHYLNLREGKKFGEARLNDIMKIDGLMDPFHNKLMGMYAEATAKSMGFLGKNKIIIVYNHIKKVKTLGRRDSLIKKYVK